MAGQWLTADEQRAWRAYLRFAGRQNDSFCAPPLACTEGAAVVPIDKADPARSWLQRR
jgi:hypothetical protein